MDFSVSILLIVFCASISVAEPITAAIERRRSAYPVYTNDLSEEYEPYAVAAFPLHAHVPIIHVLSPSSYAKKFRKPSKRPKPENDVYAIDTSQIEQAFEPYADDIYTDSVSLPKYSKERDQYEDEASSVIVYARPNKNGGFSYRKPSAPRPVLHSKEREPIIIRIHKYRVIH